LILNLESLGTQHKIEQWHELHEENYDSLNRNGKIKLQVQWIYSRLQLINDKIYELTDHQKKIEQIRRAYERELNIVRSPFLLILNEHEFAPEDEPEMLLSVYQVHPKEQEASKQLDILIEPLRHYSGLGPNFWAVLFTFSYLFYVLITLLICIYKPDFINLTICTLAFYLLPFVRLPGALNAPNNKKKVIRV